MAKAGANAGGEKEKTKVIFIKKKGGGHGAHGGAWKVAYADFVTAMMALFMVLWLLSSADSTTREALSSYFRTGVMTGTNSVIGTDLPPSMRDDGMGVSGERAEQRALERSAVEVERALDRAIGESPELEALREQIDVQVTEEGLLIQITDGGDTLFFQVASATLTPELTAFLERIAPVLGRIPNEIQIHGHTDARPYPRGSTRSNWDLSFERANQARMVLERSGLRERQVLGVLAHGDTAPLVPSDPLAAANRRLSILAVRRGSEEHASIGQIVPVAPSAAAPAAEGEAVAAPAAAEVPPASPATASPPTASPDAASPTAASPTAANPAHAGPEHTSPAPSAEHAAHAEHGAHAEPAAPAHAAPAHAGAAEHAAPAAHAARVH